MSSISAISVISSVSTPFTGEDDSPFVFSKGVGNSALVGQNNRVAPSHSNCNPLIISLRNWKIIMKIIGRLSRLYVYHLSTMASIALLGDVKNNQRVTLAKKRETRDILHPSSLLFGMPALRMLTTIHQKMFDEFYQQGFTTALRVASWAITPMNDYNRLYIYLHIICIQTCVYIYYIYI